MGFSAGGHVCASCGVRWNDPAIVKQLSFRPKKDELKAAGIVLGYPFLVPNSDEFFKKHPLKAVEKVQHIMNYVLYQSDFPSQKDVEKVNLINYISQDTVPMFLWHSMIQSLMLEIPHALFQSCWNMAYLRSIIYLVMASMEKHWKTV